MSEEGFLLKLKRQGEGTWMSSKCQNSSKHENLNEGGVTPFGGGKKRVKLKKWRGINEKKGVGSS